MTFDDGGWCWAISLSGIGVAVVLCVIGVVLVVRRALALKARLSAYADLPILALANRTQLATSRLPQSITDATQLVPRMQRALVDLQKARDSMERSALGAAVAAKAVGDFFTSWRKR